MEVVSKARQPHRLKAPGHYTLKRKEFKKAEDVKLITHFAKWLSSLMETEVNDDNFTEDLLNGVILCQLMMRIDGSGISRYHTVKAGAAGKLDVFKARENIASFQAACLRLGLPVSFGYDELAEGDLGTIASTLVYVAHAAAMRNVGVVELDSELKQRLGVVVKEKEEEVEEEIDPKTEEAVKDVSKDLTEVKISENNSTHPPPVRHDPPATLPTSAELSHSEPKHHHQETVDLTGLGLTLTYIASLFPPESIGEMTVKQVTNSLIVPLVKSKQDKPDDATVLPLTYLLHHEGSPCVSKKKADVFVVYDQDILWRDLMSALECTVKEMDALTPSKPSTLWMECFSQDSIKLPIQQKEVEDERIIQHIGRLMLVFHPWDKPTISLKSPCVWDVCCAVKHRIPIIASFLPKEKERFFNAVCEGQVGSKTFQKVFYDLNVEKAMAQDSEQILRVLRTLKKEIGATAVNDAFIIPIKNWILETLKRGVDNLAELPPQKRSNLFMTRGAFHQCLGQPDEARKFFDKVLVEHQKLYSNEENPTTGTALSNLASTLRELGEFKEAEQVCEKALNIRVKCLGESHPAVIVSRAWLGDILLAGGEYKRALPILQKVLDDQKAMKASDMEISSAINNLASALRECGEMEEARKNFEEVLLRVERAAGVDHPLYGAALNNCALTLETQKDYAGALKMHEKSLALRIRALGNEHPDVALSMHNLGVCLLREDKVKNREKAVEYGKKAIEIWEKTLGPKHITVNEAKKDWAEFIKV